MHAGSEAIGRSVGQEWAEIGREGAVKTEIVIGPGGEEVPGLSWEQGVKGGGGTCRFHVVTEHRKY